MKKKNKMDSSLKFAEGQICGFDLIEIFKLYAFVDAYEWSDIKQVKNEMELFRIHPELMGLKNCMKKILFKKSTIAEMEQLDITNLHNHIYCVKHGSQLFSFLYHLRNAIAHACVQKVDGMVQITTFLRNRPTDFAARGLFELKVIELFTNELKKVIL